MNGRDGERRAIVIVLRAELGEVLRSTRAAQGRTLRDVSADASISLGYLSEIERGEKEASSELLAAVCGALGVPMSDVLTEVATRVARAEAASAPVVLPVGANGRRVSASAA